MDIMKIVINRVIISNDPDEKYIYNSERLVAVLVQIYGYMMENGLEFSYVTTGKAFVYLWIREQDPQNLYYHLAEPASDAEEEGEILLSRTGVGQTLAVCLMALNSKPRDQEWRNQVLESVAKVEIDLEVILEQIPVTEKKLAPPSSVYKARVRPWKKSSPYALMYPSGKQKSCNPADPEIYEDPADLSSSSNEDYHVDTPTKPKVRPESSNAKENAPVKSSRSMDKNKVRQQSYCTQACLSGLTRKGSLDESCPNVNAHRRRGSHNHVLKHTHVAKLLTRQISVNPENGCQPLNKQGARGALFKIVLESYEYTFVAKGTVPAYVHYLQHESSIYRRLAALQGTFIPVYLGNVSMIRPYFLDVGVRIIHMLLMSWGGEEADTDHMSKSECSSFFEAVSEVVNELRQYGVEHMDARDPNVLWNEENGRWMLIDFERSKVVGDEIKVRALKEVSENTREKERIVEGGKMMESGHKSVECAL